MLKCIQVGNLDKIEFYIKYFLKNGGKINIINYG